MGCFLPALLHRNGRTLEIEPKPQHLPSFHYEHTSKVFRFSCNLGIATNSGLQQSDPEKSIQKSSAWCAKTEHPSLQFSRFLTCSFHAPKNRTDCNMRYILKVGLQKIKPNPQKTKNRTFLILLFTCRFYF